MAEATGRRMEKFVGLDQPPTLVARPLPLAELMATRVRWSDDGSGYSCRFERNAGYLVCLQRRDMPVGPYWVDDRPMPRMPLNTGQFLLLDLNEEHAAITYGMVDCISIYTPTEALNRYLEEHGLRSVGALRSARGMPFDDATIRSLGEALMPAFERPETANQLFIDYVALALMSHLTGAYGEWKTALQPMRAGLAPRQERRAKETLLANIESGISLADLAREAGLSRSHFARAFKATTGLPPHRWLLARRLERACELLLATDLSLDNIAARCGFADQSHFTRAFAKAMGATPGHWRRSRRL